MAEQLFKSPWKLIGIGKVTENKLLEEDVINFKFIEQTPLSQGDLVSEFTASESKYKTVDGIEKKRNVIKNSSHEAIWLPGDDNWTSPPDVQRDERVFIFQYGDADPNMETNAQKDSVPYFWRSMGLDKDKRRLERRTLGFSGTSKGGNFTYETHYFFEISPFDKHIIVENSGVSGELARWSIQMLAGTGVLNICDKISGLGVTLNAVDDTAKIITSAGAMIALDKEHITEYAVKNYTRIIGGDYYEEITGNREIHVGGVSTKYVKEEDKTISANISSNGAIWLNGPIGQREDTGGGYDAKLKGSLNVENIVHAKDFSTPVITSYNGHIHQGYHGPTQGPKNP